jgi:Glycosyl transferase family group 2
MQDVEFAVYGHLFQAGRNDWGTAGMGGNGQFNRLSALDEVSDDEGPWRDKLTEDQDLGLRLIAAGREGRQDLRAIVNQQGLSKLRPLRRQRTRWSQGNLQAIGLHRQVMRAPFGLPARLEQLAFIFLPFWQGIIGLGLVGSLILAIAGTAPFWGGGPAWQLVFFHLLAFGGTSLGCMTARSGQGPLGWLIGFLGQDRARGDLPRARQRRLASGRCARRLDLEPEAALIPAHALERGARGDREDLLDLDHASRRLLAFAALDLRQLLLAEAASRGERGAAQAPRFTRGADVLPDPFPRFHLGFPFPRRSAPPRAVADPPASRCR